MSPSFVLWILGVVATIALVIAVGATAVALVIVGPRRPDAAVLPAAAAFVVVGAFFLTRTAEPVPWIPIVLIGLAVAIVTAAAQRIALGVIGSEPAHWAVVYTVGGVAAGLVAGAVLGAIASASSGSPAGALLVAAIGGGIGLVIGWRHGRQIIEAGPADAPEAAESTSDEAGRTTGS
ncbi:MAG TPA: hypothetical protein VK194_09785 [Candidatus Deferrimicrobium sp.]|nr:hypothetical protein [Candidatus Deferrimicrobium sp.]